MKYLKKFETLASFQTAQATLATPNVSLIEATMGLNYLPYVAPSPTPSHVYVEIGGIKWATMNLGANSVTDYGLYYQWGDTQGYTLEQFGNTSDKKRFYFSDYKFNPSGDEHTFTKYNSTDELITLQSSDDAITAAWGSNWRMPSKTEWDTLDVATNKEWTSDYKGSGVAGLICIDKTDNTKVLFLPGPGSLFQGNIYAEDLGANYWTNLLLSNEDNNNAWVYSFYHNPNNNYLDYETYYDYRSAGALIRGILDDSNS